jgi:hypothetical protein
MGVMPLITIVFGLLPVTLLMNQAVPVERWAGDAARDRYLLDGVLPPAVGGF